ncbi:hypothetical protein Tco_0566093 [Tanacetum coccineum]
MHLKEPNEESNSSPHSYERCTKKTPQESASLQPQQSLPTTQKATTTHQSKQPSQLFSDKETPKRKLLQKVRKGKPTFQLVDEDDEAQQMDILHSDLAKKLSLEAHQEKREEEGDDADLERAIKLSLDPAFLPQGKGKAVVTEEQVAHSLIDMLKKKRTTDQFILVRRDQTSHDSKTGPSSQPEDDTSEKVIHESSSTSIPERYMKVETEVTAPKVTNQEEVDTSPTVTSE